MSQPEHKSLEAVKVRRLDAMSDTERAEFEDVYAEERRRIEIEEGSDRGRS